MLGLKGGPTEDKRRPISGMTMWTRLSRCYELCFVVYAYLFNANNSVAVAIIKRGNINCG